MAKVETEKLVTAEDLARMKIDGPCELVEGRIVLLSPAGMRHGVVGGRILSLLVVHVTARKLGLVVISDTGFWVRRHPDTVRAPDVAFLSKKALERAMATKSAFFPFAPDLAVEVLSPDDSMEYVEQKVRDYLSAGTKLVWVVDPKARIVYVYAPGKPRRELEGSAWIDGGRALPKFRAKVSAFFGDYSK